MKLQVCLTVLTLTNALFGFSSAVRTVFGFSSAVRTAYSGSKAANLTVADGDSIGTAYSGSKAANLTVADGDSIGQSRDFENRFVNDNTDLWLDFFWRIEDDFGWTSSGELKTILQMKKI